MAQREAWLEEQRQVPALRREGTLKLTAVLALHLMAVSLFTSGFLLSRNQVDAKSGPRHPSGNSLGPQYDKAVLLVVDAMRSDFVCVPNASEAQPGARTGAGPAPREAATRSGRDCSTRHV